MMERKQITPDLNVEYVLKNWPETIPVFLKHRMGCVGCTMASYETLTSAAEIYQLPLQRFMDELQRAVDL